MKEREPFTPEQKKHLQDLVQSLDLQAVLQGWGTSGPAEALSFYGTPYEDLCKEERLKLERHPWDLYPVLERHAAQGRMPEDGDTFLFMHQGLFNVAPAQPGFMCRLRIPGCKLRGDQLARVGDIAEELAGGYAHVTTRGNLQIREVPPENILRVLTALYDAGLTSKGAGADSVRNITCPPTAGFDRDELVDLIPYAVALHHHILNARDLHGIPRKFNIAFDGGGSSSVVGNTNDICFLAARAADGLPLEKGVYCRILLGGITGHGDFAKDSGFAVLPEQAISTAVAILRVFVEHGNRSNRKRARLKYLLEEWGVEKFCAKVQEKLDFELLRAPAGAFEPRKPVDRQGHIGVHPQSQKGLFYIGVALPVGLLQPAQMRGLAEIAMRHGNNDIRLTVWQNLLIPHIPKDRVEQAVSEIQFLGLETEASSFAAGAVACTGRFGCRYASSNTKEHAAVIVGRLQKRFQLDEPINIHLSGCEHSCAQHYIGDIGLLGALIGEGENTEEAYQVFLGGGSDNEPRLARFLAGPVPAREIADFLEHVVGIYLERRKRGQSFAQFTRALDEKELQEVFAMPARLETLL
jgi:ferredoxin-nitrite reductase